jgi:hypothetical protein
VQREAQTSDEADSPTRASNSKAVAKRSGSPKVLMC